MDLMQLYQMLAAAKQQQGAPQDPRNVAPGMGSTANAIPMANPLAEQRAMHQQEADASSQRFMNGVGLASGSMAAGYAMPPALMNPVTLAALLSGVVGGSGYAAQEMVRNGHHGPEARRLQYQGS